LIVWVDGDGVEPETSDDPPNPNDPARKEFHTSFGINAGGDEIFLYDVSERKFQVIDGLRWGLDDLVASDPRRGLSVDVLPDDSLSRCPEAVRDSHWVRRSKDFATPRAENFCGEVVFRRGDAGPDPDGALDISDAVQILGYLFLGEPAPACYDAADFDDSGLIDITDSVALLGHLFLGEPPPPDPGKDACGVDPTGDELGECRYPPINCG
jgi:hypothetical protein